MERRSGNTTRLINDAVEALFTEGEIFIPDSNWLEKSKEGFALSEIEKRNRFIDFNERPTGNTQRHFKRRLIKRLDLEHQYQYEVSGNWIKLKNNE